MTPPIHVAAAVIRDDSGRVLLTRRPDHVHQGGLWEFPGGKLEPGESVGQALRRELHEELGIDVSAHSPVIRLRHDYPDKSVVLDVHLVTGYSGTPDGREGQPLAWVSLDEIHEYPLPAADRPIITALRLPSTYVISGEDAADPEQFLGRLQAVLERGHRLIQFRAPGLAEREYLGLAVRAIELCRASGARLLLNSRPDLAMELDADGVHLTSGRLLALDSRPLPENRWLSASCHNARELEHAVNIGVDFVVLSPVLRTASHPDAVPLGWERFGSFVGDLPIPVFALGGMSGGMEAQARRCGGQGVAGIRGFW
jgi:8-oxo-dGTP diphosphatase